MKTLILLAVATSIFSACSKNKLSTRPQIEISSYNTKVVAIQGTLLIDLKFRDKEGDIGQGSFIYIPIRTNRRKLPSDLVLDSVSSPVPNFPDNTSGSYELKLPWSYLQRSTIENDSFYFRFVAIDRAGNKSDTVNSAQIVVLHQ